MSETKQEAFEGWCILELMGHRKLAGHVSEETIAGKSFIRLDIHTAKRNPDMFKGEVQAHVVTQFYSADAVYCLTPTTEEIARGMAENLKPTPVQRYELPAPLREEKSAWAGIEDGDEYD